MPWPQQDHREPSDGGDPEPHEQPGPGGHPAAEDGRLDRRQAHRAVDGDRVDRRCGGEAVRLVGGAHDHGQPVADAGLGDDPGKLHLDQDRLRAHPVEPDGGDQPIRQQQSLLRADDPQGREQGDVADLGVGSDGQPHPRRPHHLLRRRQRLAEEGGGLLRDRPETRRRGETGEAAQAG
jgi:hypothetical protein